MILANPWLFPAICLPFSLLVGLLVKHRNAPTNLDESLMDSLAGDVSRIDWRALPVNIVMAWVSLFSGAVLGPEGGIGGIGSKIAILYAEKVGIPVEERSRLVFSTLASAYNGLIANPLFTGGPGHGAHRRRRGARKKNLPANLIGGHDRVPRLLRRRQHRPHELPPSAAGRRDRAGGCRCSSCRWRSSASPWASILAGLIRVAATCAGTASKGREVERALVCGLIFSAVGMVAPILLFSGETQVQEVVADPARYGPWVLVAMALVKLALLAVAFKGGFLGGPTFPAIFASTCVALAVSLLLPGPRVDVLIAGVMAGFLMVLFRAPLMVILLTVVMLQAPRTSPRSSSLPSRP